MAIRKAALGARWASVTDIGEKLRQAQQNRQAQQRLLDELEQQVQRRRTTVDRSLADLPSSQRSPLVGRAVSGFKGELNRMSAEPRLKHVREAARIAAEAAAVRDHYRSPIQMLMRHELGSDRRSRLMQQIEASGPAELASLAEFAAATKDMELAAALCGRVAGLAVNDRPFAPSELADALVGEQHRHVTANILEMERLAEEALHDDSAFERGSADSIRHIRIAKMKQAEDAIRAGLDATDQED